MVEISNLSISIKDRFLIKNLSLTLNQNDKLAIIGEEGNGKSTLLKGILGICEYAEVTGSINTKGNKIGYLEQSLSENNLKKTGYEFIFSNTNSYNYSKKIYKYLESLNLDEKLLDQKLKTLSGGEKIKISILKLLLEENDILFLDEPTNDLDIETLKWLENFINSRKEPIIYISHDETLLSNTANMILHIEQLKKKMECKHTLLRMDYDTYVNERLRKISKQTQVAKSEKREFDKKEEKLRIIMQKVESKQNTISRKNPHSAQLLKKKMHSLKAQEKKLNNLEITEIPDYEESINFFFEDAFIPSTKKILNLDIKELKVENKVLAENIELDIVGNKHICIIGKNGVGKSTLIKIIYENLKNRTDIKVGYIPQTYDDVLNNYKNVLDFLCTEKDKEEITKVRMYLGNMNFTRDEMMGEIKNLSGGSKAKLFLIKLVLDKCNVLILDEPTRNVSPLSNPVIRKVLKEFNGTIISISHDRKYIDEVANEIYELTKDGLIKLDSIY